MQWRLVLGTGDAVAAIDPCRGAINMALDSALLETSRAHGVPIVRFYAWSPACLSLGRNQRARDAHDARTAIDAGIDVVRRPTGGLAVLHDRELTYSVVGPIALFGGPRAAYTAINRALVEGLRLFGVRAVLATPGKRAARVPSGAGASSGYEWQARTIQSIEPCFLNPSPGEVLAAGRKLVGSAQRCDRGFLLQHGSILLDRPKSHADLMAGSITLSELGAMPSMDDAAVAMRRGFENTFGIHMVPGVTTAEERARMPALVAAYEDEEWTWRR